MVPILRQNPQMGEGCLPEVRELPLVRSRTRFGLLPSASCLNMRAWGRFWKFAISRSRIARPRVIFFER